MKTANIGKGKAEPANDLPNVEPAFTAPDDDTPEIMKGYNLADHTESVEQMLAAMEKAKVAATRSHDVTALPKTPSELGIKKFNPTGGNRLRR